MTAARGLRIVSLIAGVLALGAAGAALAPHRPVSDAARGILPTTTAATTTPEEPTSYTVLPDGTYDVIRVIDGDTLDVAYDEKDVRLRLIGMDTPEVVDPRKPIECFGEQASAEGKKLISPGADVRIAGDAATGAFDKYGRTLAYVYLPDGTFYNLFMIANGYAHQYDYDGQKYAYRTEFEAAQSAAKNAGLGFWSPSTCNGNTTQPAL